MKNKQIKHYILIVVFLTVAVVFRSNSQTTVAEFLIFFLCGVLAGINIYKIKNSNKND